MRACTRRRSSGLLFLLPLVAAGCQSAVAPQIRTIASIGDRPLPSSAGPADVAAPERLVAAAPRRSLFEGSVSGRVYDAEGRPMPGVRVRVADDGTPLGRVAEATTDPDGGFTLHGLRRGGSYTVIAEADDRAGRAEGRQVVRAPDRQVRISLQGPEALAEADPQPLISPVSERVEGQYEPDRVGRRPARMPSSADRPARRRYNEEDILPSEAEALAPDPAAPRTARAAIPRLSPPLQVQPTRWRPSGGPAPSAPGSESPAEPTAPEAAEPAPTAFDASGPAPVDEGPNPLPPAIERPRARADDRPAPGALTEAPPAPPRAVPEPARERRYEPEPEPEPADDRPFGPLNDPLLPPSDSGPADPSELPGAVEAAPPAPAPRTQVARHEPAPAETPAAAEVVQAAEPPSPEVPPGEGRRRPSWAELVAAHPELTAQGDSSPPPDTMAPPPRARREVAAARGRNRNTGDDSVVRAACDFDGRHQRLVDFTLPDLQGRPVRFRDLDADFILLDFWGSWCPHCINSVPHLVDLQNRLGPGRLVVLGVAYEEGSPAERVAAASGAAQRLGINYPVLLGGLDGPCPLQEALHVSVYPTMVLLDRSGQILWRAQGAAPMTLARLDRVLAAKLAVSARSDVARR